MTTPTNGDLSRALAGVDGTADVTVERLELLLGNPPPAAPASAGAFEGLQGLEEAQVLDATLDVARSQGGVLLETRQSGAVAAGNAAVLVAHGLSELRWTSQAPATRVHAFSVGGGGVVRQGDDLLLTMACDPRSDLVVRARSMSVHLVQVPGLPRAPVDYGSDDDEIRAGTPSWQHPGALIASWAVAP